MSTTALTPNCCAAPYYYVDGAYSLCKNCGNARLIKNEGHNAVAEWKLDTTKNKKMPSLYIHTKIPSNIPASETITQGVTTIAPPAE